jgi:hypothetical protein
MTRQASLQDLIIETLDDQSFRLVQARSAATGGGNAGCLLSAVLERVEAEENGLCSTLHPCNSNYAAHDSFSVRSVHDP